MTVAESDVWLDLQRDAEQYGPLPEDLFVDNFGTDSQLVRDRCFFVVDTADVAVGAVSAWHSGSASGSVCGRVHWLAVRPVYQGRGLGKALLGHCLQRLAAWHQCAWLSTATGRLRAIGLYLNFGFIPDLAVAGARRFWEQVQSELQHPRLGGILGRDQ